MRIKRLVVVSLILLLGLSGWKETKGEEAQKEVYVPEVIIEGKWGSGPGEFGLFKREMSGDHGMPNCIEVDKKGCLYILDPANGRILKFDKDGRFIRTIDLEATGFPEGDKFHKLYPFYIQQDFSIESSEIKMDNNGYLYISATDRRKILKFSKNGKFLYEYNLPRKKSYVEEEDFSDFYFSEKGDLIAEVAKGEKGKWEKRLVKLTPSGMVKVDSEVAKKIWQERKLKEERIKTEKIKEEPNPELSRKGYVVYYSEIIGEDKENNLYIKVGAKNPDIKKYINQIYKYSPEGKLLSIFGEREEGLGEDIFVVTESGVAYELWIPVKMKKLSKPKAVYSPEGELWGYAHQEYIFPEYVKVIKWEKRR